ncbi:protein LATERAL ROOT PRIMORDIUM 1-like isoform X2 [Gastrolobium bilobum]|uniref:protein LATERAL ROOT PRIMORDIUM 1-like isoform X2 n=1 Tax=Gastrolobium bilobum TaxID=150636 RepID=UPI002AAF4978|nr:protein LATERAL ROOT PRIMORDIUM 1-like isoform X2 [Gastrolobium bilobum]
MSMLGLRDLVLIAPTPSLHQHQHQHRHQHQHQHHGQPISADQSSNLPLPSPASLSVGFGIFPLLTATPCMPQPQNNEVQECGNNNNNNYWNLTMCPEVNPPKKGVINVDVDESHKLGMENEENGVYGADFRVCQDCGNRAKKDCIFRRCRTCCKGRGYDCNTHVKSTWIPSIRRREREIAVVAGDGGGGALGESGSSGTKRPKTLVGSSQNATATSLSSNSNDAGFKQCLPGHVRAPAVFRCHRVSAIGNGEDEVAYLATVHISGHVFKGFLYDHGVDGKDANAIPCVSELQLGNNCSGKNREISSAIEVPTNSAYPASAS